MRNIDTSLLAELTSPSVRPAYLAELFFDSGVLRLWTGYGTLVNDNETYFGGGNLIGISAIDETQDVEAKGMVCSLNGVPSNLIALALGERSRGRRFRLYIAGVSTSNYVATEDTPGSVMLEDGNGYVLLENQIITPAYRLFAGLMDVIEITDNGQTADLRLSVENALIVGRRAKVRRYTTEDQKRFFPDDMGLEFINQLQDKEIVW